MEGETAGEAMRLSRFPLATVRGKRSRRDRFHGEEPTPDAGTFKRVSEPADCLVTKGRAYCDSGKTLKVWIM